MEDINNSLKDEIKALALLDSVAYELIREATATKYKIRVGKLDEFVDKEKRSSEEEKSDTILFPKVEPWPDEISLPILLHEIVSILNKYISFNSGNEPIAIALWVVHTYTIEAAYITPTLFVTSPEMRSGKSTLLTALQRMAFKSVYASSITPSVVFRLYTKHRPTMFFDEADSYELEKNEELRGVLNAGHSRDTSGVLRTNPVTLEPERFDAFGAKCIAAIKGMPITIEDRSIIIQMRRMTKGAKKEKMRMINAQTRKEFSDIQRKCTRFANDNTENLKLIKPALPDELNDRAADNWCALFQIAGLAGKEWLKKTLEAALQLSGIKKESKSQGTELLEDILNLFDGIFKDTEEVTTAELIDALASDEEAPWGTYNSKRQIQKITPKQLANLLAPYEIKSKNNVGVNKLKGYSKSNFQDAFSRYVTSESAIFAAQPAPSAEPSTHADLQENEENNSIRSNRSTRSSPSSKGADSGWSRTERMNSGAPISPEIAPSLPLADVADINTNTGSQDYIDV